MGNVFYCDVSLGRRLAHSVSLVLGVAGYAAAPMEDAPSWPGSGWAHRLTVSPGVLLGGPADPVRVEIGVSRDLRGKNSWAGTAPFLRVALHHRAREGRG